MPYNLALPTVSSLTTLEQKSRHDVFAKAHEPELLEFKAVVRKVFPEAELRLYGWSEFAVYLPGEIYARGIIGREHVNTKRGSSSAVFISAPSVENGRYKESSEKYRKFYAVTPDKLERKISAHFRRATVEQCVEWSIKTAREKMRAAVQEFERAVAAAFKRLTGVSTYVAHHAAHFVNAMTQVRFNEDEIETARADFVTAHEAVQRVTKAASRNTVFLALRDNFGQPVVDAAKLEQNPGLTPKVVPLGTLALEALSEQLLERMAVLRMLGDATAVPEIGVKIDSSMFYIFEGETE